MKAGTDYISLSTREYSVKSLNGWGIRAGNKVGEALETWGTDENGNSMSGTGYYLNTERAKIDVSPYGLKVDFNPSTLLHPFELITERSDLQRAVDLIQEQLNGVGVDLDLYGAGLNRVDLTKQAPIKGSTSAFTDVWNTLQGKRMQRNRKLYPDGFSMGNTQRQAVFYNKSKQLKEAKKLSISTPEDLTRAEVRWIKSKSVGSTTTGLGVGRLRQLLDTEPEALTEAYNGFLLRDVFRTPDGWQTSLDFNTEVELLQTFRENNPKAGIRYYIELEGVEAVLKRFGGVELFAHALHLAGYERTTVYRTKERIRKAIEKKGFLDTRRGEVTTAQKVDYLRNLFCA